MEDRKDREGHPPLFSSLHLGHHTNSPPYNLPPASLNPLPPVLGAPHHSQNQNQIPPPFQFNSPPQSRSAPPPFSLPHPNHHGQQRRPDSSLLHSALANGSTAQKRAYRQRRKDPSCDACRERKVKCDATEMSSCTECSTRNVKCQFTKETNRRMSSVKMITDMNMDLAKKQQEIDDLKKKIEQYEHGAHFKLPAVNSAPIRQQHAPPLNDDPVIRTHFRNYAKGLFKPPPPHRIVNPQSHFLEHLPAVPPKQIADALIENYYVNLHAVIPIIHWPSFVNRYEEVYRNDGNLMNVSPSWASMLFGVFACGRLYSIDPRINAEIPDMGRVYLTNSRILTDLFNDEFTIDHARSALLTSIYLLEMNRKSAAWTWLGSTVRIAQDIGLHRDSGPWKSHEAEMRRRVWWGIYVWDRLLSMELGRVLSIEDGDCDVNLPASLDDHFIYDTPDNRMPAAPSQSNNFLLTTIHVVRAIGPMLKALQSPTVSHSSLNVYDSHLSSCLTTFPEHCQPNRHAPLKPQELSPICYLMNTKLVLHRHNLSTHASFETRMHALERCVDAARDTVLLLQRAMKYLPPAHEPTVNWREAIAKTANAMLCTHIWRCALFLSFRRLFSEALVCVEVLAAIGEMREINTACGRYLSFFIEQLGEHIRRGESYESNETMLALVSGDLQGSTESSWVWHGGETGTTLNSMSEAVVGSTLADGATCENASVLSLEEARDWGGWGRVEGMLRSLASMQEARDVHVPTTSASRISIANII